MNASGLFCEGPFGRDTRNHRFALTPPTTATVGSTITATATGLSLTCLSIWIHHIITIVILSLITATILAGSIVIVSRFDHTSNPMATITNLGRFIRVQFAGPLTRDTIPRCPRCPPHPAPVMFSPLALNQFSVILLLLTAPSPLVSDAAATSPPYSPLCKTSTPSATH